LPRQSTKKLEAENWSVKWIPPLEDIAMGRKKREEPTRKQKKRKSKSQERDITKKV
jgi:hypothetical protein